MAESTHTVAEGGDLVQISYAPLDAKEYIAAVQDDGAGGISVFIGTTRDTFEGKEVLRLEYEAYVPMALAKLTELCKEARAKWPLAKVALGHRLGLVPVGDASVIVAVSSTHRHAAIEGCRFLIDELKARVPIWKKEVYASGETWKENKEFGTTAAAAAAGLQ